MSVSISSTSLSQPSINLDFYEKSKEQLAYVRKVIDAVSDYFAVAKLRISTGHAVWKSPKGRVVFDSVFKMHVQAVWSEYFKPRGVNKVLEMGAGYLDDKGKSFLSAKIPAEVAMTYSDLDIAAFRDSKRRNYVNIDSCTIGAKFKESSFDAVIGSCFIDNLPSPDLLNTLKGIQYVLKQGGLFFHILDLQPLIDTIITDYRNHADVLFPWTSENGFFKGVQLIPRSVCDEFAARSAQTEDAIYLKEYLALSNNERAMLIIGLCEVSEARTLSDLCVMHFGASATRINNCDYFSTKMSANLQKTNFRIIKSGIVTKQAVCSISSPVEFNDIACFHGNIIKNKIVLPDPKTVRVTQGVHVIIAEKI